MATEQTTIKINLDQSDANRKIEAGNLIQRICYENLRDKIIHDISKSPSYQKPPAKNCPEKLPYPLNSGLVYFIDGMRGAGKSTFLESVYETFPKEDAFTKASISLDKLAYIDPSRIENNEIILLPILSSLKLKFEALKRCSSDMEDENSYQEFRKMLKKLAGGLSLFAQENNQLKDLDPELFLDWGLERARYGMKLRNNLHALINKLCELCHVDALILAFDDADTNFTHARAVLDLLAAWRLLRRLPDATAHVYRVECDLAKFASQIFGEDKSCIALEQAMQFRGLNLRYLMASQEDSWCWKLASCSDLWRAEAKRVHEAKRDNKKDVDMLWTWLSDDDLWKRSEELIEVDTAYFNAETFIRIQQQLMTEVRDRKVVVETLPSSNVRISQYYNFREHHSLRWMRVPGFVEEGDPEIMVSLGSDDPGIFAGDLNGEFYQLYAALRNEGLGDKTALDYLAPINERGRQYRFHHPSLR